jgi:hypothetical protein
MSRTKRSDGVDFAANARNAHKLERDTATDTPRVPIVAQRASY